jgi:membrane-bound lytic murein transglycosylase A
MSVRLRRLFGPVAGALVLSLAVAYGQDVDPLKAPDTQLEPITWKEIDGWAADDHAAAFAAFRTSCNPFLSRRWRPDKRAIHNALRDVCKRAAAAGALDKDKAKALVFFEENFSPVRIAKLGESTGLLTGYYEPIVDGSRFPSPEFSAPLHRRPPDLVIEGKKAMKGSFPNRAKVGRYNAKKGFEPYHDRLAIEEGALDGQRLEICWLKDHWEAMTIQIQGSARVRLEDGTIVRLNYDAHNGHSYTAVGRVLIERNLVARDEMSMDRIRQWMVKNPDKAKEVRGTNKSYVFFRITGLNSDVEPSGAQGVPLAPRRSIAVDRIHVYGTPFFIDAELPIKGARTRDRLRQLWIAQDTGSAIIGPARADLYFGAGDEAGQVAGRIRQQGKFVMLLPRSLDMVEAGKANPLPPRRPAVPDTATAEKKKANEKKKAGAAKKDADAKAKQETAGGKSTEGDGKKTEGAAKKAEPPAKQKKPGADAKGKSKNAS